MGRPQLSDDRILLRIPDLPDVEDHFQAATESIPEVGRWLPWCHEGYSLQESRAWVERCILAADRDEAFAFFVFAAEGGRILGSCGTGPVDRTNLATSIGYWIRTSESGRGIATRAVRLVARFCFQDLGLQRVELLADVENIASQRVAEKAGFRREGLLRNRIRHHDAQHDAVCFSRLPTDPG